MVVFIYAAIMILLSGFREVGIDYDSANYAYAYRDYEISEGVEISFLLISSFLHLFSDDVHAIFLFYAFVGVSLKFLAVKRLSNSYLVPLMVYLCNYYELHECMQIRSGILGGFYLFSLFVSQTPIDTSLKIINIISISTHAFTSILTRKMLRLQRSIEFTSISSAANGSSRISMFLDYTFITGIRRCTIPGTELVLTGRRDPSVPS